MPNGQGVSNAQMPVMPLTWNIHFVGPVAAACHDNVFGQILKVSPGCPRHAGVPHVSRHLPQVGPVLGALDMAPSSPGDRTTWLVIRGMFSSVESFQDPLNRLYFCARIFCPKKENVHLFSSSLPRLDTSRIFPRTEQTFASARSFGVIS